MSPTSTAPRRRGGPRLPALPRSGPTSSKWPRVLAAVAITVLVLVLASLYPALARGQRWLNVDVQHPWRLLGLLVVPFIFWWTTFGQDRRVPRLKIGTAAVLFHAPKGWRVHLRDVPGVLRTVAIVFFIGALARPVLVQSGASTSESGIDIMLALDLSGSMQSVLDAEDEDLPRSLRPEGDTRLTRLDTAKVVVQDFIQRRRTDRMGAVLHLPGARWRRPSG
ncbi:MAG: BatA domain-containing protein [Myxococcota bacterium]